MKSWCDLSWREKCKIKEGDVPSYKYLSGYSFDIKQKVKRGKEKKEQDEQKSIS